MRSNMPGQSQLGANTAVNNGRHDGPLLVVLVVKGAGDARGYCVTDCGLKGPRSQLEHLGNGR